MEYRLMLRAEDSNRSDDNLEVIRKRFRTYSEQTLPIIEHFRQQNKCRKIGSNRSIDEVFQEVSRHLIERFSLIVDDDDKS